MHERISLPDWNSLASIDDASLPLFGTALLVARDEYPQLDPGLYDRLVQDHAEALRDRALAYLKMGHRHGARRDLERYLQRNPKAADTGTLRERLVELNREHARPH